MPSRAAAPPGPRSASRCAEELSECAPVRPVQGSHSGSSSPHARHRFWCGQRDEEVVVDDEVYRLQTVRKNRFRGDLVGNAYVGLVAACFPSSRTGDRSKFRHQPVRGVHPSNPPSNRTGLEALPFCGRTGHVGVVGTYRHREEAIAAREHAGRAIQLLGWENCVDRRDARGSGFPVSPTAHAGVASETCAPAPAA
jgi:hypothetical protein